MHTAVKRARSHPLAAVLRARLRPVPLDPLDHPLAPVDPERIEQSRRQIDVVRLVVAALALVDDGARGRRAGRRGDRHLAPAQRVLLVAAAQRAHHADVDGHHVVRGGMALAARAHPRVIEGRVARAGLRRRTRSGGRGSAGERYDGVDIAGAAARITGVTRGWVLRVLGCGRVLRSFGCGGGSGGVFGSRGHGRRGCGWRGGLLVSGVALGSSGGGGSGRRGRGGDWHVLARRHPNGGRGDDGLDDLLHNGLHDQIALLELIFLLQRRCSCEAEEGGEGQDCVGLHGWCFCCCRRSRMIVGDFWGPGNESRGSSSDLVDDVS